MLAPLHQNDCFIISGGFEGYLVSSAFSRENGNVVIFDEMFVTGCTESFRFDNFRCSRWRKFRQKWRHCLSMSWFFYEILATGCTESFDNFPCSRWPKFRWKSRHWTAVSWFLTKFWSPAAPTVFVLTTFRAAGDQNFVKSHDIAVPVLKWSYPSLVEGRTENIWYQWPPGGWFNIKMQTLQYRKSHCGDKTI